MPTDYDNPWKELLERYFDLQLAFFFPEQHAQIDWTQGYESLNTELRKIVTEAESGKRIADALFKAVTPGEGEARDLRYLHLEVQCQFETDFVNRLDDCNALCKLRLHHPVITLVILGDDNPNWRPAQYLFMSGGFRKQLDFPPAKILDYHGREDELARHPNPVGLFVAGHLLTLNTRLNDETRETGKLRLLEAVVDRRMEREDEYQFCRLIDWIVELPRERQKRMWERFLQYTQEKQMPFLMYPEQVAFDKGRDEGMKEGLMEGKKEGKREGKKEGLTEGKIEGLLEGIERGLELRFGADGLALLPAVQQRKEAPFLEKFHKTVLSRSTTLEDLKTLLAEPEKTG